MKRVRAVGDNLWQCTVFPLRPPRLLETAVVIILVIGIASVRRAAAHGRFPHTVIIPISRGDTMRLLLLCLILLLTACQPELVAPTPDTTPTPPPLAAANTPTPSTTPSAIPTTTPLTTATLMPTPAATATPTALPAATCLPLNTGYQPPSGRLQIHYIQNGQPLTWDTTTGTAVPRANTPSVPIPPPGFDIAAPHPAGNLLALARWTDTDTVELWLDAGNARSPRFLTTATTDDTRSRYPTAANIRFHISWLGDTEWLTYRFVPEFNEIGDAPYEELTAVSATTGDSYTLFPANQIFSYRYLSPWGEIAAIASDGLRLITVPDATTATILLPTPFGPDQQYQLSPDASRLVLFTETGLILLDRSGSIIDIPLPQVFIGLGHYRWVPALYWQDDTHALTLVPNGPDVFAPDATFSLWEIDIATGTAVPQLTLTGFVLDANLSPDFTRLAYWTQDNSNNRQLTIADIASGTIVAYTNEPSLEFFSWSPDGNHFAYWRATDQQVFLGNVCDPPQPLDLSLISSGSWIWLDDSRYLSFSRSPNDTDNSLTLHLHDISGSSQLIGTFTDITYEGFSFE